jgi:serine/threonine protein kinase
MPLPTITEGDIKALIPQISSAVEIGHGGQRVVFRATCNGQPIALKFALLSDTFKPDHEDLEVAILRAQRETQILRECTSPHMVKLGPIGMGTTCIAGQNILYYSEEFIDGQTLNDWLRSDGPLHAKEVVRLGLQMCSAIADLWSLRKIHRDIKPGNIMRRSDGTGYVLLDAGLAFDVAGESISAGFLVGTMAYFSPEQFDYTNRRAMDFRSDMFSLGVTLYEAATGQHPFFTPTTTVTHLFSKIMKQNPVPPSSINSAIPATFDKVILRMMGKSPHLRYRRIEQLRDALAQLQEDL